MAIEKRDTSWSEGVFLICEKCGKSLDDLDLQESGNASENLKKHLKSELKKHGLGKRIRVVTSSCLDICIKNTVAVSFNPVNSQVNPQENFTVHPEEDRCRVLNYLVDKLD